MPKRVRLYLYILLVIAVGGAVFAFVQRAKAPAAYATKQLSVGDTRISLQVADTDPKRELGLSNREAMAPDTGMVFEFDKPQQLCFWMKDMRFPIDMIWLDADKRIVQIKDGVDPKTYPENFCSPEDKPATYVIELTDGRARQLRLVPGQQLRF